MNALQEFKFDNINPKDLPYYVKIDKKAKTVSKKLGAVFSNFDDFKKHCKYERIYPAGYVYLILFDDGRIKFGSTLDPLQRISQHQGNSKLYRGKNLINEIFISDPICNFREVEREMRFHLTENGRGEIVWGSNFWESVLFLLGVEMEQLLSYYFAKKEINQYKKDCNTINYLIENPKMLSHAWYECQLNTIKDNQEKKYQLYKPQIFTHGDKYDFWATLPL